MRVIMVNTAKQLNIQKPVSKVLSILAPKNKEVLERRFGINRPDPETLESIGESYGITRERVRQIQEYSLKKLAQSEHKDALVPVFKEVSGVVATRGGVCSQEDLFSALTRSAAKPYLALALKLMPELVEAKENDDLCMRYALDKKHLEKVDDLVCKVHSILHENGSVISIEELNSLIEKEAKRDFNFSGDALVALSKRIKLGPFGDYGIAEWAAITPKGVRDKAHLVFEKEQRPLHFTEISSLIDKYFNGINSKPRKKTHPQTVHNELIKDPRFILIGRGLYALSEWGYEPGTVKDVLVQILKEHGRPLLKEEVLELVSERRFVKPNTVFLNLQNRNYFKKVEGNRYYLA